MRWLAAAFLLLPGACDSGHPPPAPVARKAAAPASVRAPSANVAAEANVSRPASGVPRRRDDPDLADLSPAQRRAYELGYRDCSDGRYAPGNHLEAYRIGCAAAHDD